jgi:hypothetical protein
MEVGNISASQLASQATDAVGVAVLKKSMDLQEQAAMQLIVAVPSPSNNPPNLGQNVDTTA